MKIALGADHRGFALKEDIKSFLEAQGHILEDVGAYIYDKDDDYPDFAYAVARLVADGKVERGILLCGSGMGMDIVANKARGVRATIVRNVEEAWYARDHDDVNVITLAADRLDTDMTQAITAAFLETSFSGKERHVRRLEKLAEIEHGDVFDEWNDVKKTTDAEERHYFREGDIFFARVGKNIGFEQDGRGSSFLRPVLVAKAFNRNIFLGIMLTTKQKNHPLYMPLGVIAGKNSVAILSQVRLLDAKRLEYRIGRVSRERMADLRRRMVGLFAEIDTPPLARGVGRRSAI